MNDLDSQNEDNDLDEDKNEIREANFWVYLILFMIYSVGGAILEHLMYFMSTKKKPMSNPILIGFPIYGLGAYLVVWISRETKDKINPVAEFFFYAFILSAMEYAAGIIVGAGKNSRMECGYIHGWDYSKDRFNLDGIVKLQNFIGFGIFGLIIARLHPRLVEQVNKMFEN